MGGLEDWMCTASGRKHFIRDPDPAQITIEDIAHGLSNLCRFGGHVRSFYSVAQHSVLVSRHVDPTFAKAALLHDATEAYVGDVIHPLKQYLPEYKAIERRWEAAVAARFELPPDDVRDALIKRADLQALVTERRDVACEGWGQYPWKVDELGFEAWRERIAAESPSTALENFLDRWDEVQ